MVGVVLVGIVLPMLGLTALFVRRVRRLRREAREGADAYLDVGRRRK